MTIIPEPSIFSTSDWGAEKVNTDFLRLPYRACGVVVHHTDTEGWKRPALDIKIPAQLNIAKTKAFNLARIIQHDHLHIKGWSDSGMHFLVTRDGLICEGRTGSLKAAKEGKFIKGAHAGNNFPNQHCWGIEFEGNTDHAPLTDAQWKAGIDLIAWLMFIQNIQSKDVTGHKDWKSTDCPGSWFYGELPRLRTLLHYKLDQVR